MKCTLPPLLECSGCWPVLSQFTMPLSAGLRRVVASAMFNRTLVSGLCARLGSSYQQCLIGSRTHHGPVISDKDRVPMPRALVMGPSHLGDGLQGPLAFLLV